MRTGTFLFSASPVSAAHVFPSSYNTEIKCFPMPPPRKYSHWAPLSSVTVAGVRRQDWPTEMFTSYFFSPSNCFLQTVDGTFISWCEGKGLRQRIFVEYCYVSLGWPENVTSWQYKLAAFDWQILIILILTTNGMLIYLSGSKEHQLSRCHLVWIRSSAAGFLPYG